MIYVGHISDGTVVQVTVEQDNWPLTENQVEIGPENTVGIGWSYANGVFSPPDVDPE